MNHQNINITINFNLNRCLKKKNIRMIQSRLLCADVALNLFIYLIYLLSEIYLDSYVDIVFYKICVF